MNTSVKQREELESAVRDAIAEVTDIRARMLTDVFEQVLICEWAVNELKGVGELPEDLKQGVDATFKFHDAIEVDSFTGLEEQQK